MFNFIEGLSSGEVWIYHYDPAMARQFIDRAQLKGTCNSATVETTEHADNGKKLHISKINATW